MMKGVGTVPMRGIMAGILGLALSVAGEGSLHAQERTWGFGSDLGFISGTVDDTIFALGFNLDYYPTAAFSVGPMVLFSPGGDLTEVAFAGVGRYHFRFRAFNLVPFTGVGFVHASLDRGSGLSRVDESDTSFYIPLGLAAEYPLNPNLTLSSTLIVNIHDLDLGPVVGSDHTSVALLFGFRFGP
jgi:hypothetical protein